LIGKVSRNQVHDGFLRLNVPWSLLVFVERFWRSGGAWLLKPGRATTRDVAPRGFKPVRDVSQPPRMALRFSPVTHRGLAKNASGSKRVDKCLFFSDNACECSRIQERRFNMKNIVTTVANPSNVSDGDLKLQMLRSYTGPAPGFELESSHFYENFLRFKNGPARCQP
jgi:hypothetical protein